MQTIYLDVSNKGVTPRIYAKQSDVGRNFVAVMTDGGVPFEIPEDALISIWYEGASGSGNYTDIGNESAISVSKNLISVELIHQMLAVPGCGEITIVVNSADGKQIGFWNIQYDVERVAGWGSESAKDYFSAFSNATENLIEASRLFLPDKTLTQKGRPAEAYEAGLRISALEGRVNELSSLPDGSTTGDAELADARVGYDGETYENVGEHIRDIGKLAHNTSFAAENLVGNIPILVSRQKDSDGGLARRYTTEMKLIGDAKYLDHIEVPVLIDRVGGYSGVHNSIVAVANGRISRTEPIAHQWIEIPDGESSVTAVVSVGEWFLPGDTIIVSVLDASTDGILCFPSVSEPINVDWLEDRVGEALLPDGYGSEYDDVRFVGTATFYDTIKNDAKTYISYDKQALTTAQQAQAMENIGVEHYYHAAREEVGKPIGEITTEYTLGLYDALMNQYPDKVKKNEIHNDDGTFTNYEYVISTGQYNTEGIRGTLDTDIKKPKYLVMSGIHGREKAVMMSLYRFVRDVLSGHNVPSRFLESTEIHVVPCVTPYSIDTTERNNENGVNINRNFDWEWNKSSISGAYAASEKETQAIVNWLKANQDSRLFLDLHNSGNPHEVAMVLGLKGNEAVNIAKRTALQGLDRVIPFWRDVIKYEAHEVAVNIGTSNERIEVREPVFSYSSYVEGASNGGYAVHYATGKLGIASLLLETTICANADYTTDELADITKAYSAETIAAGADAIGNILLEFFRQQNIVGNLEKMVDMKVRDIVGDIAGALDAIIQMQSPMTTEIENALDSIAEMQNSMIGVEEV